MVGVVHARRLTVTASNTELLNASDTDADCSELFKTPDTALPLYITRLRATHPSLPAESLRFQWSLPGVGTLIADDDIPADEEASVIRSMCGELGNGCMLTEEQLKLYAKPTILWIAPICEDALPKNATQPYRGGQAKIAVVAMAGKRKQGKGSVTVGYGRTASVLLGLDGRTGQGKPIPAQLKENFSALVDPRGVTLPTVREYQFDNGDGDSFTVRTTALQANGVMTYQTPGKHVATVAVELADGSALCDNLLADVQSAVNRIAIEVITNPKRTSYRPGDPQSGNVSLRVRVKNVSDPATGSGILLEGANVLSCETSIRVGKSELTHSTQVDFQHCSKTLDQACDGDADCAMDRCPECEAGEKCQASSHCERTVTDTGDQFACVRDSDCLPGDRCVVVLPLSSLVLPIGDASDLVTATIPLANTLTSPARVTETWTVHPQNAPEDSANVRYTIESNPDVKP